MGSKLRTENRPFRLISAIGLAILLAACSSGPPTSRSSVSPGSAAARPRRQTTSIKPAATASTTPSTTTSTAAPPIYGIAAGCCIQWLGQTALGNELDAFNQIGAKWLRFDFDWADIQSAGPTSYNWTSYDNVVKAATSRGIKVLGMIGYTPSWAQPSGCNSQKCPPANASTYANFAGAAAAHFAPLGVHAWEIWNEPNVSGFWLPKPNPAQYTTMLKAAYTKIKAADPSATVVTGGTAAVDTTSDGTNLSSFDFDSGIYQNGGKGYFDALGQHPYCFVQLSTNCPNGYSLSSAWSQMADTPKNLVGLMQYHGDGSKKIWGTEFGAPTNGTNAISEAAQATMITNAYTLWKTYSWAGPLFVYTFRDPGTNTSDAEDWFGLVRYDWSPKPSFYAYKTSALGA
jgi:polysaccharide biosynthesis protein PslG